MNRKISKLTALAILSAFCIAVSLGLSNERIQAETVSGVPFVSAASSAAAQQAQAGWCVKNAQIAASVNADGKVSVFRLDGNQKPAGGPFAEFQLPADGKFTRQAPNCVSFTFPDHRLTFLAPNDGTPVLRVGLCPLRTAEARTVKNLRLPEIRLSEEFAADSVKALGTAGLTPVDGHKGSYAFLAVAKPETRKGVVCGWITSLKGSGIVFSSRTQDGKGTAIQPEIQYGRYPIPAISAENAETTADRSVEGDVGEWFVLGAFDDSLTGLETYADQIAEFHKIQLKPQISGYCTWYSNRFGGSGNEVSTREFADVAAEKLVPFGMSFFQIDDSWQLGKKVNGPKKNFTAHDPNGPYRSGMKPTAEYLNSKGLRAGIWFMPFSGNWNDPYYADKQEWFAKSAIDYPEPGQKNTRRYSGINQKKGAPYETFWGGTSLDMTDKDVEKYVHDEVDQIANKWGYKYFKYDGMWTAMACEQLYVNDEYLPDDLGLQIFDDMTKTNVEIYRKGLNMVRAAGGDDVFILGCNVSQNMRTMAASYGLVDAMRIGPDNGASWSGICKGPIRGTARYFFNGRVWFNDPDPVYVRDSIPLSHAQLITSWAAVTGQLFAFSDWLPELSPERLNVLQRTIAPACLYTARPLDVFEVPLANVWKVTRPEKFASGSEVKPDAVIFGLFNWSEKETLSLEKTAAQLGLDPNAQYAGFDFWADSFVPPFRGNLKYELPGGSCRIFSLVRLGNEPQLVSTNRHVTSPLFEVKNVKWDAEKLTLSGTSTIVANDPYELRFILPGGVKPVGVSVSEKTQKPAEMILDGRTLRVRFTCGNAGDVRWSIAFERGETPVPQAVKPQDLTGNAAYHKVSLTWDETPNFGFLLTKTYPDGSKKTFTLTSNSFTDFDVKTSESYVYALQAKGWEGDLSSSVELRVAMPETIVLPPLPPQPDVNIADLKPLKASTQWGSVQANRSAAGHPLTLNGKVYAKGVGIHAAGNLTYAVPEGMTRFTGVVGLDDFHTKDPRRSVYIKVWTDVCEMGEPQVLAAESPLLSNPTINVWHFNIPLDPRVKQIRLEMDPTSDGINCDHVDWVDTGFCRE
ncbi:MAG: NPCBM/NEW2 domain-containing protein [Thermoguttaceae bacterium]|nr:NPCBM/NEW2 domain-containing protein [Thermoguttaceae bacterium]